MMNLKKDLIRSRFLIRCVKVGRGYFNILREETAMKKKQQQLQKLLEEELEKFQPAQKVPDTHYRDSVIATYEEEKIKKLESMRPFSPVHSCIMAPSLPDSHVDPLFRQLCALHWLLEALTIDHTHHAMRPLIACWNPKDPGGSKSSIKKINKDKSMGQRWDHFVTAPKTKKFKVPAIRTASRKLSRRASTLSLSRTSGGSSPQSSMLSVNPGSDELPSVVTQGTGTGSKDIEDNESSSTKPEEEPLHPVLQKLLEMVREDARRAIVMTTEMQKKHPSLLSLNKSDYVLKEWQMTHKSRYFDLLSKLPEDLKSFRPARKILSKLQKFGENLDLRIRPHVLLKVLQDLRIWELCSPDIAVAIEFVREHIIHMPQEDYINWLQGRVGMPIRQQPAPP
ncbi:coiled-coil domain-containing protein 60 isoform X3 [Psammomys obesus]|uniref:coiled-coil domain-containing protein 60 isoform X3 n=1 Tax=Psammomys obesus TaxID=48139 RepID=UPI0024537166|nr:coiled-coil domain-containing protein 60 isoform X3 [Psammomys obesus]